jgi:tetratricopeptide (TPR) repeat protein
LDIDAVRAALESERKLEAEFVERARQTEKAPKGWPAALLMFHLGMWRERMRERLAELAEGRPVTPPPPLEEQDQLNDRELASGIGTPLTDAAGRSDHLLAEVIELYAKVGERSFPWYRARTTTEAVLGNSYTHPRAHMYAYLRENGDGERATRLYEEAVAELRAASAPAVPMGAILYNLACARAIDGNGDEALALLDETIKLRPDMREKMASDKDFESLREEPRFKALLGP